ncbi:MAG: nucleotide exchange factor GrpE [Thermoplasmatota archaeon]
MKSNYHLVVPMSFDDEFEFELDDDDEEEEESRPIRKKKGPKTSSSRSSSKTGKKTPKKTGSDPSPKVKKGKDREPKKEPVKEKPKTMAKRNPVPDGIKRKLALDLREIKNLKKKLEEYREEKESFEHELELLEDEIDRIRSEKERMEEDINKQIALASAYEKKLNRNQKDFDNFRKRTQNDVDRQVKLGHKKAMMGIIEIIDNFDRAITEGRRYDYKPEVSQILEGVDSIRKSMLKLLEDNDVEMVDPMNEAFNPHFHEAIETRTDLSVPDSTVVEVASKGFIMDDIVLRPAKVYVSKGGEPRKKKIKKKDPDLGSRSEDDEKEEEEEEDDITEIDDLDEIMEEMDEMDDEE